MVTAVPRDPETTAVIAAIAAAPLLVGDGIRPTSGGYPNEDPTKSFVPYCVVYPGIISQYNGSEADPDADVIAEYQVTSIGETAKQARMVADKARGALVKTPPLTVPNRYINLVRPVNSQPVRRDDATIPPLFYQVDVYQIISTPA